MPKPVNDNSDKNNAGQVTVRKGSSNPTMARSGTSAAASNLPKLRGLGAAPSCATSITSGHSSARAAPTAAGRRPMRLKPRGSKEAPHWAKLGAEGARPRRLALRGGGVGSGEARSKAKAGGPSDAPAEGTAGPRRARARSGGAKPKRHAVQAASKGPRCEGDRGNEETPKCEEPDTNKVLPERDEPPTSKGNARRVG